MTITPDRIYPATCARVIDGDTFVADIDLGFTVHAHVKIRIHGIDVYERSTPEGKAAKQFLMNLLMKAGQEPTDLMIRSYKDARSFERWVADVWWGYKEGQTLLADTLRGAGYEKPS